MKLTFQEIVNDWLDNHNMTQLEFANKNGINAKTLSKAISEKSQNDITKIEVGTLLKIANGTGYSLDFLLGLSDNPSRDAKAKTNEIDYKEIKNKIGLDIDVIKFLETIKENYKELLLVLNTLLSEDFITWNFLYDLNEYFIFNEFINDGAYVLNTKDFSYKKNGELTINEDIEEGDFMGYKGRFYLDEKEYEDIMLRKIVNRIKTIKENSIFYRKMLIEELKRLQKEKKKSIDEVKKNKEYYDKSYKENLKEYMNSKELTEDEKELSINTLKDSEMIIKDISKEFDNKIQEIQLKINLNKREIKSEMKGKENYGKKS